MRKLTYLIAVVIVAVLVLDIPAQTQSVVKQLRQGREKEQAGDLDGAIQVYQEITTDTAVNQRHVAQAYYRMGVCYLRKGDRDNAKKQFERLVSEFPRKLSAVANARRELKKIRRQERSEEMKRTRAGQLGRERDRNKLFSPKPPPTVVRTTPANFADNVPPASRTISVTFNQQMMDESWSWMQFDKETFPEAVGRPHYDREKRTCTLRVKLKPATAYLVGINSGTAKNFKSTTGEMAKAYALVFATADITGRPTAIPEEMLARARAINGTKATKELAEPAGENLLAMVPAESLFCIRVNHFEYTLSQIDQFLAGVDAEAAAAKALADAETKKEEVIERQVQKKKEILGLEQVTAESMRRFALLSEGEQARAIELMKKLKREGPSAIGKLTAPEKELIKRVGILSEFAGEALEETTRKALERVLSSPIPMAVSISVRTQFAKMLGSPQLAGINMAGSFTLFGPIPGTDMSDPNNIGILVPVTDYKEFVSGNPNVSQPDENGVSKITSTGMHPLLVTQVNSYALVTPQGNDSELIATAKSISEGEMTGLATALDATEAQKAVKEPIWAYANIQLASKVLESAIPGMIEQMKTTKEESAELKKSQGEVKGDTVSRKPSVRYSVLREWKPYEENTDNGLGLDILLESDLNKDQIISFLKNLSKGKDPVDILIFTDRTVYENEKKGIYGPEFGKHFLLVYIKNTTVKRAFYGIDEIRWMQESGKFSHLFGKKTPMPSTFGQTKIGNMEASKQTHIERLKQMKKTMDSTDANQKAKIEQLERSIERLKNTKSTKQTSETLAKTMDMYASVVQALFKEGKFLTIAVSPKPNVLNITYTMSAVPGTEMADSFVADSPAVRGLIEKLKAEEPKQMGAGIKPILALLPEADKADFVGTYNLIDLFKKAMAFAPAPMPQMDIPTKSNIAFAGKVGKETMTVDIALPKEHLAEIMAAAMMMQQKMMQTPMIGGRPAPPAIPVQPGRTIPQKPLVIKPLVGMGEVHFGMTIEQARQILGEPQRMTGRACEYLDSGFTIVPGRDGIVAAIMCGDAGLPDSPLIKNCKCRTDEGVGMGSSRQDVVSAYGRPSSVEEFIGMGNLVMLKYDNINAGFVLRDDKLVHMTFRKPRRPISR